MKTVKELKRSSTEQIIKTFKKVTGNDAWEMFFNPFEERELMIVMILGHQNRVVPEKGLSIEFQFTPEGFVWGLKSAKVITSGKKNRRTSEQVVKLIRQLRADGESIPTLAGWFGLSKPFVSNIINRKVFADI